MPAEVIMPMLGLAQDSGTIIRWLKEEGQPVVKGEPLVEVETDKVTVEVEAPADGTLGTISAAAGDEVPVGTPIAYVLGPGESAPATAPAETAPVSAAPPVAAVHENGGAVATEALPARALASPKARRMASRHGLRIEDLVGSGPRGAVVAADVERFLAGTATGDGGRREEPSLTVSSAWRTMAERTQASWRDVPHFSLTREIDASRLNAWRDATRRRPGYDHVTHTDLLVKVVAAALQEHPRVQAMWRDGIIETAATVNVGVAVATDDALVVPVIQDAGRRTLREVADARAALVTRARERKLRAEDVSGGTFTISNLGMFGVDAFSAIVNAPQTAILAVGRIAERVVVVDGAPAVRPTCVLTLSFDHRVVDGAAGARFLDTLVSLCEEPAGLVD
jgi:pyruvate dehydrogenase E2 component (dihydrolipoamide acetyltransferase)